MTIKLEFQLTNAAKLSNDFGPLLTFITPEGPYVPRLQRAALKIML